MKTRGTLNTQLRRSKIFTGSFSCITRGVYKINHSENIHLNFTNDKYLLCMLDILLGGKTSFIMLKLLKQEPALFVHIYDGDQYICHIKDGPTRILYKPSYLFSCSMAKLVTTRLGCIKKQSLM